HDAFEAGRRAEVRADGPRGLRLVPRGALPVVSARRDSGADEPGPRRARSQGSGLVDDVGWPPCAPAAPDPQVHMERRLLRRRSAALGAEAWISCPISTARTCTAASRI